MINLSEKQAQQHLAAISTATQETAITEKPLDSIGPEQRAKYWIALAILPLIFTWAAANLGRRNSKSPLN